MDTETYHSRHHGYLGTVIELHIRSRSPYLADQGEDLVLAELERLEKIFNIFDEHSEITRFVHGEIQPRMELLEVWEDAERWRLLSGGAFSPTAGHLARLWAEAAETGALPDTARLTSAIDVAQTPYAQTASDVTRSGLDLNAIAKGWIVDRIATEALESRAVEGITINAGGDLLHRDKDALTVGIEDPNRPFDNVAPLVRVELHGGALATSGGARRGWTIGGNWYSHVIDPRTGHPVDHVAQASVIAPYAATADAVATILTVMTPDEGATFADSLGDVGFLVIGGDGSVLKNGRWQECELS